MMDNDRTILQFGMEEDADEEEEEEEEVWIVTLHGK